MILRCAGLSAARRRRAARLRKVRSAAQRRSACAVSGRWIDLVHARRLPRGIVPDMDSSVSPTHGEQEMSVWNGHYACTCYFPLFVFNQFGDLERCANQRWRRASRPKLARYSGLDARSSTPSPLRRVRPSSAERGSVPQALRASEANRRNARKSAGPTTEEGKQRSRCNAFRHALTAETVIGALEDAEDYKAFEAAIIADYVAANHGTEGAISV